MALFIQQNENQSKLQEKLVAELREKAKTRAAADGEIPNGVDDSNYLKNTKTTTSLAWVWILILLVTIAAVVAYIVSTSH